ncbi:MAG: diacylglycerol/lipid kinase family protein [Microthrixaceae bacterium]
MSHTPEPTGGPVERVDHDDVEADPLSRRPAARHRLAAIGSLLLLLAAFVVLVVAFVRGLPGLLVPLATAVLAAWAAWKALSHRGPRRSMYAVLAVFAVIATLALTAWLSRELPGLLLSLALFVLGAVLASTALTWIHQPSGRLVGPARHPVLIVNPRSGDGASERAGLADEARARGIRVVELTEGADLVELARRELRSGVDVIGMAGGDGSLALVAGMAMDAKVPFVCVPAGTRNHFALDLGLDRTDPVAALDAFGEAVQRRIDVATVNGRRFLNNVSIGAYGEVVASEDYRDNKIGVALQTLPSLLGPDADPLDLRFTDGVGTEHESAVVIHVSNNSYDLAPRLAMNSRPSLIDGDLGVVAVVKESDLVPPRVLTWQTPQFTVASGGPVASGIDGEFVELTPPVEFRIEPLALRIRMSRSVLGVSPGAKRPSLTLRTVRRLLAVAAGRLPLDDVTRFRDASIA